VIIPLCAARIEEIREREKAQLTAETRRYIIPNQKARRKILILPRGAVARGGGV
jgi:hypothetical protein